MKHHHAALGTISVAGVLDFAAGAWYASAAHIPLTSGLCYALGVATTSGSSVPGGTGAQERLITALMQLTILPLFGATFSLATSSLSSLHVWAAERSIKEHVEARLKHHLSVPDAEADHDH